MLLCFSLVYSTKESPHYKDECDSLEIIYGFHKNNIFAFCTILERYYCEIITFTINTDDRRYSESFQVHCCIQITATSTLNYQQEEYTAKRIQKNEGHELPSNNFRSIGNVCVKYKCIWYQ